MTVHFVCDGNVYRSRLCEVYFNSKKPKNLTCFSSGIVAGDNLLGPICWLAQRLIEKNKLFYFMSFTFQKTSKELLANGDYTIFMERNIYEFCRENLGFNSREYEIWDIRDLDKFPNLNTDLERMKKTEETFERIKEKVDNLLQKIGKIKS